jgi:hypothetical protein
LGLVHNAEALALRFQAFWGKGLLGGFDSYWLFAIFFGFGRLLLEQMITFVVLVRCVYIETVMEHFLLLRSGVGINVVLSAARNLTAVLG